MKNPNFDFSKSDESQRNSEQTMMGDKERDAFLDLLAKPPEPSETLVKLMRTKVVMNRDGH